MELEGEKLYGTELTQNDCNLWTIFCLDKAMRLGNFVLYITTV